MSRLSADVLIRPGWPAPAHVGALSTTRRGGVSGPPFSGLNLGDHVGDAPQAVAANRALLEAFAGVPARWLNQVHGTRVVEAAGCGDGEPADAALVREPGLAALVMTADCLPVLLCDRAGTVAAAAHAGWRGLAAGVLEATLAAMARPAAELHAWLGPAIGAGAFEVGDEVRAAFVSAWASDAVAFRPAAAGKWWADLQALAALRLRRAGVASVTAELACTVSSPAHFFSYRRDGVTGRMATLIWLQPR